MPLWPVATQPCENAGAGQSRPAIRPAEINNVGFMQLLLLLSWKSSWGTFSRQSAADFRSSRLLHGGIGPDPPKLELVGEPLERDVESLLPAVPPREDALHVLQLVHRAAHHDVAAFALV